MKDAASPTTAGETSEGWLSRERALGLLLMAATILSFYLCYRLVLPFVPALAWALALAVVARPIHEWIAGRVRNPDVAAGLAVVVVALMILLPAFLVMQQLAREATSSLERFQQVAEGSSSWRERVEANRWLAPIFHHLEAHFDVRRATEHVAGVIAPSLQDFLTGSFQVVFQSLITLFSLYYLFRDRHQALSTLRSLVPLSHRETDEVFARVGNTIHATVYGTIVVSLVQGALGGVMFWWLGLPAPVLWGVVMALLAIIPYLGAFVVWGPAAIYLAIQGDWTKAAILTGWGTLVIGFIDNLLYPLLVGNRLRLHTLPVFFAILGGLGVFGASGLILGPVVLAVTIAIIQIWRRRTANGGTVEEGIHEEGKPSSHKNEQSAASFEAALRMPATATTAK